MATELENRELIYYMITNIFITFYLVTTVYYIQKTKPTVKRAAIYLNDLFWEINEALEDFSRIEYDDDDDKTTTTMVLDLEPPPTTIEIKYEDKYLKELEKLNPNFQYTWDMIRQRDERMEDILKGIRIKIENEMKMLTYRLNSSDDQGEKEEILERLEALKYTLHNPNEEEIKEEAKLYVKNNYLDGFVNNFIMEKTPAVFPRRLHWKTNVSRSQFGVHS